MSVWIIFDNCPQEFDTPSVIGVYKTEELAWAALLKKKERNAYKTQYYEIQRFLVQD